MLWTLISSPNERRPAKTIEMRDCRTSEQRMSEVDNICGSKVGIYNFKATQRGIRVFALNCANTDDMTCQKLLVIIIPYFLSSNLVCQKQMHSLLVCGANLKFSVNKNKFVLNIQHQKSCLFLNNTYGCVGTKIYI